MAALALAAGCGNACALELEWEGIRLRLDGDYSAGAAARTEDPDPRLLGIANGGSAYSSNHDDGNQEFKRGDWVAAATRLLSDIELAYGDAGVRLQGLGFYDAVADQRSLFDTLDFGPLRELGLDELDAKRNAVRGHTGHSAELLQGYIFSSWKIFGRELSLQAGRQSLDWGNDSLIDHGLNSLRAVDLNRLRLPGALRDEGARPAGMVQASFAMFPRLTLEGFYQYEWRESLADAAGTFWSVDDFLSLGGTQMQLGYGRVAENTLAGTTTAVAGVGCLPLPPVLPSMDCVPLGSTIPRGPDRLPRGRQYGGALSFTVPFLNDAGLKLHAARYHSRTPLLSMVSRTLGTLDPSQADTARYFADYPEGIKLYGLTLDATVPGLDVIVAGEYTRKNGQPLQLDDVELLLASLGLPSQFGAAGATLGNQLLQGWRRYDVSQARIGFTRLFGPRLGYDQLTVLAESGLTHVHGMQPSGLLRLDIPGTDTPADPLIAAAEGLPGLLHRAPSATSWGYRVAARVHFFDVLRYFTLEPTLRFVHDVAGITPSPLGNFVEGRRSGGLSLGVDYLENWRGELGYTSFFGGGDQNLLLDRDFVDLNLRYSF